MSPTGLREIQQDAVFCGVLAGGCCLFSLFMNKFTNISRFRCGMPVNTIAKIGVLAGIFTFEVMASITLIKEKFPGSPIKQTIYSILSYSLSCTIYYSIAHLARDNLGLSVRWKPFFLTDLISLAVASRLAYCLYRDSNAEQKASRYGVIKVFLGQV